MMISNEKAMRLPLLLKGKAQTRLWGGTRFHSDGGERIGEIWSLSVREREEENCTVSGGFFDGMTLKALIEATDGKIVGGKYRKGDRFPLLIKLLDTSDTLSLQVHPDGDYAREKGADGGKTEMWYVLDCEKDAYFFYGMKEGYSSEHLAEAIERGECASLMQTHKASPRDVLFVPAGMPHAIGGGIFLAEIQENSDVTYRLDDYGRRDASGKLRELHVADGLAVSRPFTEEETYALRFSAAKDTPSDTMIADTVLFRVSEVEKESVTVEGCFRALIALEALEVVTAEGDSLPLSAYDTCFLPAHAGEVTVTGRALLVSVPMLEEESDGT